MTWRGPTLDSDQRVLAATLDSLAADRAVLLEDAAPVQVSALIAELAGLGVWTLGATEEMGGGGADELTTAVALERMGRSWPAVGWASVQAHAAVDLLGREEACTSLVQAIHAGSANVAVVDAASAHVNLSWSGDHLVGTIDRVDAASKSPHLVVLDGDEEATLVLPAGLSTGPVRTTGLGGSQTCQVSVNASADNFYRLGAPDVVTARIRLALGAAIVAAGIAGAAADEALEYASGRHQFGDALTAIPTVRQSLLSQAARTAVILTAAAAMPSEPVQAAAVLREACDQAIEVAAAALQSHGGYGYLTEYSVERRLRDAVSLRAAVDTQAAARAAGRRLVGHSTPQILRKDPS
ncbi:acyl-CoA dehydrogenase [Intrasporangium chromatireducens Q5-1]|uniref:Acyl-CoA dehydrogenase n=1 Tax=Intrasporangium chromatireducens Q5-1 TaxID=584657 RepID=W9GR43_9MICO|nr:acyl-CoA dehydrogenase family protein [Intrasporangium chromatireducens]EWT07308.1 acyl-CoA dehydrogenase [Intrasporangium chromatireducens Q5-1]